LPFLSELLPNDLARYFKNNKVFEKMTPAHWWLRSDSPKDAVEVLGTSPDPLVRIPYLQVINKSILEPFIK